MIGDDFDEYDIPDESGLEKKSDQLLLPDWVSATNSSLVAYQAIIQLFQKKLSYIRKNKKRAAFKYKYSYQINKSEVARAIGKKKPNAIFHSVDYANDLTDELVERNKELLRAKEKSTSSSVSGLNQKTKSDLVSDLKKRDLYRELAESKADEILDLTLAKMSLDLKTRLGLV